MTAAPTVPTTPGPTRIAAQRTASAAGLSGETLRSAVADSVTRAQEWLLAQQSPEGWWKGELETNVTMDAEDLLMRHVLGILTPQQAEETARWIRSQQRADGTWATWYDGPADLSTTVEAYVALRLAGDRADEPQLLSAATFIRGQGGLPATRVFTRIWLAMVGLWSWDDLPVLPPELVLLPKRFPLALPQWGCWARQTIVPLAIVSALRPSTPVPFDLEEFSTDIAPAERKLSGFDRFFLGLDKALHQYERLPLRPLRRHAMRAAAEWIIARQEADGSWGGIQPPWVYSVLALRLMGYPLEHPVLAAGLQGLERFTMREETSAGVVRRLEACQSPVWDTALALVALGDSGAAADSAAMRRAGQWLLDEEVTVRGDWAVHRPDLAPGGWAFEFDNDLYPDVDDTAEVVLALRKVRGLDGSVDLIAGHKSGDAEGAIRRGVDWVLGMQCADGGWAAFDADQTGRMPTRLPFCDFGEVVDPPSADVTAHAVEMLVAEGLGDARAVRRGVQWLLDHQETDGSWFGRWGVNHVYGTGAVVPALVDAGVPADGPALQRAVRWLLDHQQPEGGWGEDIRSYLHPETVGEGPLTASQTGWALLALLAVARHAPSPALTESIERGVNWLITTQQPDGSWDEPHYTGTGFPGDFSINYHLYRQVFPLTALGRFAGSGHVATAHLKQGRFLGRDR
jgi:squalene-hopene/tetraprenyl-beta-curcumene cyclase